MTRRLPNFIIAGAPRSGTTWLYRILNSHPDIAMAEPVAPEPKFFLVDEVYEKGLDYYAERWFENIAEKPLVGEKSTNYLEQAAAARRIARDLPSVKLIFILRNPIERAYSNFLWSRRNGLEPEEDFRMAIALETLREARLRPEFRFSRPHAYTSRGIYYALFDPYLRLFSRDQILVIRYEDLVGSSEKAVERVHRFLGVTQVAPDALLHRSAETPESNQNRAMADHVRAWLAEFYRESNDRLSRMLDEDFSSWNN